MFMTGQEDIESTCMVLAERIESIGSEVPPLVNASFFVIYCLFVCFFVFLFFLFFFFVFLFFCCAKDIESMYIWCWQRERVDQ